MSSTFETIARRLGLTFEAGKGLVPFPRVHGVLEGQPVRCQWSDRGARIEGLLDPSLDLGVRVRTKQLTVSVVLGARFVLGDPSFDDEVDATADDPARGAALFNPDVRGAALRLNAETAALDLTDERVRASVLQLEVDGAVRALQQVARLTRLLNEARAAVPPPRPIQKHVAACAAFAAATGAAIEYTPCRLMGSLRQVSLSLAFRRTGPSTFDLTLQAATAMSHGFGLLVRRETTLDRVRTFFGGQDLETGDAAFDPAFLVQSAEQDRALGALDADVRALLLELRGRFETVTLRDATLLLHGPAAKLSPDDMVPTLEMACTVVERVERASAAIARGPYR